MYLFDPIEGLSREELLQKIWHVRFTPAERAQCLAEATARGCTWLDLLREYAESYDVMMADPTEREAWLKIHEAMEERREAPYGLDPLLRRKDGA